MRGAGVGVAGGRRRGGARGAVLAPGVHAVAGGGRRRGARGAWIGWLGFRGGRWLLFWVGGLWEEGWGGFVGRSRERSPALIRAGKRFLFEIFTAMWFRGVVVARDAGC